MAGPPEVNILLLGDTECGKSTFLSLVSLSPPSLKPRPRLLTALFQPSKPRSLCLCLFKRRTNSPPKRHKPTLHLWYHAQIFSLPFPALRHSITWELDTFNTSCRCFMLWYLLPFISNQCSALGLFSLSQMPSLTDSFIVEQRSPARLPGPSGIPSCLVAGFKKRLEVRERSEWDYIPPRSVPNSTGAEMW